MVIMNHIYYNLRYSFKYSCIFDPLCTIYQIYPNVLLLSNKVVQKKHTENVSQSQHNSHNPNKINWDRTIPIRYAKILINVVCI